jgi:RNA polymerase sigma-70 factor, ECF subfamily
LKTPKGKTEESKQVKITVFDSRLYGPRKRNTQRRAHAEVYLSPTTVELFSFDEEYLRRLAADDPVTLAHFVGYFTPLLRIKARNKRLHVDGIDDVVQEAFLRVQAAIRKNEIRQPDRLGAYVNSVCNNVISENYREIVRNRHDDVDGVDALDPEKNTEDSMLQREREESVHQVLRQLNPNERAILHAYFFEDLDHKAVCRRFNIKPEYMRVLLHRAKQAFKKHYKLPKSHKAWGQGA